MEIKIPEDTKVYKKKILFYGYDKIGFEYPFDIVSEPDYKIVFESYKSDLIDIDKYDGIIIPSGIFENLPRNEGDLKYCQVKYDHNKLIDFQKKILNFVKSGKWVAFLVDQMVSEIQRSRYDCIDVSDTDLAKAVISSFCRWEPVFRGVSATSSNTKEFDEYVKSYGSAHTVFSQLSDDVTSIVEFNDLCFGFQFDNRVFALPFHTSSKEKKVIHDVAEKVLVGILNYIDGNQSELPSWIDNFTFEKEESLLERKRSLEIKISEIDDEQKIYRNFKSILALSGSYLEEALIEILENFFGFIVKTDDKKLDDFQILVDDEVAISGEVKGVKGDIKRSYISQIDTNREEQGLSEDIKGLLIANCNNTIEDMNERIQKDIPSNVKSYATKINVTIIRTIELLHLMNFLDGSSLEERQRFFMDRIMKNVGHVSIDSEGQVTNYKE